MIAKTNEKNKAIELRKNELSIIEIARILNVAKSSVSMWVRSVPQPEKFTAEFRAEKKQERKEKFKELRGTKEKGHPSDIQIDLHVESVKKTGEPLLSRRLLTGDGRWMIPAPSYYLGKKYINDRYIYEHRFIMEKFLGRLLNENEMVYPVDRNKLNNRLDNLRIKYRDNSDEINPYVMRVHSRGKYKSIVIPDHPYADKRGRVLLHRYVMEQEIGRYLTPEEIVHHKDENTKNNDIKNLEITTNSNHCRHHHKPSKRELIELICPKCGKEFTRFKNHVISGKIHFCSRSCSTSYYHKKPLEHGTVGGYRKGCRCSLCTSENSKNIRLWRNKNKVA